MLIARRVVLIVVVALVVLAADARCAWACSCEPPGSTAAERERATAVFAGRVERLEAGNGSIVSKTDPAVQVTFAVQQVWKGDVPQTMFLTTAQWGASCGYTFEQGQQYLVYAFTFNDTLQAYLCSRTRPLADAQDDLAVLGEGRVPVAAPTPITRPTPVTTPQPIPADEDTIFSQTSSLAGLITVGG